MMLAARLNNSRYLNWIKTSLALLYLKLGLTSFCDQKADQLHKDVSASVQQKSQTTATNKCTQCTHKSAVKTKKPDKRNTTWRMNCSANVCNIWLEEILPYHKYSPCPKIAWANSNPQLWSSDVWEIAKLFQPNGCEKHTKAEDSDCTGLLTMMQDCRFFHKFISNTSLLQEIKDVRNSCMHSGDLEISDADMRKGLDLMISLLEEPELKKRQECNDAKMQIIQLRDNLLDLSLNKELELKALNHKITELATEQHQLKIVLDDVTTRQASTVDDNNKLQERIQEVEQQITEMGIGIETLKKNLDPSLGSKLTDLQDNFQSLKVMVDDRLQNVELKAIDKSHNYDNSVATLMTGTCRARQMWSVTTHVLDSRNIIVQSYVISNSYYFDESGITGSSNVLGIKQYLIARYERLHQRVPIYPLKPGWKKRVEDVFVKPEMVIEDPRGRLAHVARGHDIGTVVHNIQDLFCSNGKVCKDIYVSGEGGCGKSCLCEHLVALWVKSQKGPMPLSEDESFMNYFAFVFFVSLREVNKKHKECYHVENMIISQLQLDPIVSEKELSVLLLDHDSLVILDGLDELSRVVNLPERDFSEKCSILTTSRPWKMEFLAPELEGNVERQISIKGLRYSSQQDLANNVISILNAEFGVHKSTSVFMEDVQALHLTSYLETPVLLLQMVGLWFDGKPLGDSQCAIYSNLIEKQIEFTEKIRGLQNYENSENTLGQYQLPECFAKHRYCQKYKSVLFKVSKLAYERLFDTNQENSLIFDHDQTEICGMNDTEVKQLLHMGILTQHKVFGGVTEELKSISFLHKTHQEFLCAVYLSTTYQSSELANVFSEVICDLHGALTLEKVFVFLCGLNADVAGKMSGLIMEKVSSDVRVQKYRKSIDYSNLICDIQKVIVAGAYEAIQNQQSTATLNLQDIYLDSHYVSHTPLIIACDTSYTKSIYMRSQPFRFWPASCHVEKVCLGFADIRLCYMFNDNFSAEKLSILELNELKMTHCQLTHLCECISSTENLTVVRMFGLECGSLKHDYTFQLNLSMHTRLRSLSLSLQTLKFCVGNIVVRLSKKMEHLTQVAIRGVNMSAESLRETVETLPDNGVHVTFGIKDKVVVNGAANARELLTQILMSPCTTVMRNWVQYGTVFDICELCNFSFINGKIYKDTDYVD